MAGLQVKLEHECFTKHRSGRDRLHCRAQGGGPGVLLTKQKCDVRVVMTADAQRFITPLPFKTLTRQPVVTDLYDEEEGWQPTHIRLADEADLLLIAPATANVIAKTGARHRGRRTELHRAGPESEGENFDRAGDERKNVAAPGHPGKRPSSRRAAWNSSGRTRGCFPAATKALAGCGRWIKSPRLPNAP
jgi:hypothetical protein